MTSPSSASTISYRVETGTSASRLAGMIGAVLIVVLVAAPAFASRITLQDLFFILTMLGLAQCWNLLAGYGGLVSIGQQAFVGFGAYTLFASLLLSKTSLPIALQRIERR